jgi:hypothetical protein
MDRPTYATPFADLFRRLTPAERRALKESIVENNNTITYPAIVYRSKKYGPAILDGIHRSEIAVELGIDCPVIDAGEMTDAAAKELAEQLNHCRRHLSGDDWRRMAAARAERIKRVVEARQQGKSTRAIAGEEGISQSQVVADLKEAGEQGCSPEPVAGTVVGKDGKQYAATVPTPRPDDEPELFAGEIREGDPEPVNRDDDATDGDPEHKPTHQFTARPKGAPPPPKPEYEGELDKVMKSLTTAATSLTRFIRSDEEAATLFVHYCTTELKTGWVLFDWKKGQALDAGNGEYVPIGDGPVFTGLRMLRRLLHVSHKYRKLPPKKLLEKLHRPGELLPSLDIPEA